MCYTVTSNDACGDCIPPSQRRGGCAERSAGADGVVRPAETFRRTDHPGASAWGCRATPPLRGGEYLVLNPM